VKSGAATKFMATSAADLETIKSWGLGADQLTVAESLADLMRLDVREDIARITSPTLVLGTWAGLHEQLKSYNIDISRADFVHTFETQFTKLPRLHFAMAERPGTSCSTTRVVLGELDAFLRDPHGRARARICP
jgi:hypothetical protein